MDDEALGRIFLSFLDILQSDGEEARRLVLHLQVFYDEIVTFAVRVDGSWAGALVDDQDAWTSWRLMAAREYWTFDRGSREFLARAGAYVPRPEEGDVLR